MIIIYVFIIIVLVFFFTYIELEIQGLEYYSEIKEINKGIKIWIRLKLFNKITFFKIKIDNNKLDKSKLKNNYNKIQKRLYKNKRKIILKQIKKMHINSKKFDFNIEIGTEDAAATALIIGVLSTLIGYLIGLIRIGKNQTQWNVQPVYKNIKFLKIHLDCIFSINLTHIINIIWVR